MAAIERMGPDLEAQLKQAEQRHEAVQAVFTLREPNAKEARDEGGPEARVKRLMSEVTAATGDAPEDLNVFRNLNRFVIQASPRFLRELASHAEIERAIPNRRPPLR